MPTNERMTREDSIAAVQAVAHEVFCTDVGCEAYIDAGLRAAITRALLQERERTLVALLNTLNTRNEAERMLADVRAELGEGMGEDAG